MEKTYSFPNHFITALGVLAVGLVLFTLFPSFAHAQVGAGSAPTAELVVEPDFPEPESSVTVSLSAYSMNTTAANITWTVDGVAVAGSQNARSITLQTGKIGKKTTVTAAVRLPGGTQFTVRKDIVPSSVDIIIESSTYVPSFYRGRALPSSESAVRVIAVPILGTAVNPSDLTYRWEYGGSVLLDGPVKGKQSVTVLVSSYSGGYIQVTVFDKNGWAVASRAISLEETPPELHFYEENPLRGLSQLALTDSFSLIGDETVIHGEPYFMNTNLGSRSVTFNWKIDGSSTLTNNADPHTITLRRTGGSGKAEIGLRALTTTKIPQYVDGGFMINF